MHLFVASPLMVPSRRSSTERWNAPAWCAPAEAPLICYGIRSRRPCCGKVRHSERSLPSCATVPLRRRRSTPKLISGLYGRLRNPGRRCSHANSSRVLSGCTSGSRFCVDMRRCSIEKLRSVLRVEGTALRLVRDCYRVGGIGTIDFVASPSARDRHPICPLSPGRRRAP